MAYIIGIICSVLLLIIDQVSKYLVTTHFDVYDSRPLIEGILNLTYIHNTGAAFGIFRNQRWIFMSITTIIIVICIGMLIKKTFRSPLMHWAILLVLSGGIGNMIDRIFRGYVVDFFDVQFIDFAIFNVADCCVVAGAALILLYFIIDTIRDYKHGKAVREGKS